MSDKLKIVGQLEGQYVEYSVNVPDEETIIRDYHALHEQFIETAERYININISSKSEKE